MLEEEYDPKMLTQWGRLALARGAIKRMKAMVKEVNEKVEEVFTSQVEFVLHCSLFPRDYEFERETLIQLWMAAGFLKGGYMENVGNKYFHKLLEHDVILASRIDILTGQNKYKINLDKVNASIANNDSAKRDRYTIIDQNQDTLSGTCLRYWHVSLVPNHNDQTTYETLKKFSELRTLLFIHDYGSSLKRIPSGLFLALESLEALDLSGSHMIELPSSIGYVIHLRYLDLSFTKIKELPESIDRLHQLQTMKLKGCNHLFALPKGMKELINLRYLEFDVLGQLSNMPKGMGALTQLRTLSAFIVDIHCDIKELKYMNQLSGSLCISGLENASVEDAKEADLENKKGLSQLELRWNAFKLNKTNELIEKLRPNNCLQELKITCYPGSELPYWICSEDYGNLVSITLLRCRINRLELSLKRLPNLKFLEITEMNRVTEISGIFCGHCKAAFPKLEELRVDGMSSLRFWTGIELDGFPRLYKLSIKGCPKLTMFPQIYHLPSLRHLEISHCTALTSMSKWKFTWLETLIIDNCPVLKERYSKGGEDWEMVQAVPNMWIDLQDIHSSHAGDESYSSTTDSYSDDDSDYLE